MQNCWSFRDVDVAARLPWRRVMTGAWLFARGGKSFWIQRHDGTGLEVTLDGTHSVRRFFTFTSEQELEAFLAAIEQRLMETGWTFQRYEGWSHRISDRLGAPVSH
jgi:hypothetical protein